VNSAISHAMSNTPAPPTVPPHDQTKWSKVLNAGTTEELTAHDLTPEEIARGQVQGGAENPSPQASFNSAAERTQKVLLVPYDMQLGAKIMNSLTEQATQSPPPSQLTVSEQFVAQCPMVMFNDNMKIQAPTCGNSQGAWVDPASDRAILRWSPLSSGGVSFGMDSAVGGNGSTLFANFRQAFTLTGNNFELVNCLGVARYTVEEKVIKINHIGRGVSSTSAEHDISTARQAFFYKYIVKAPNGSAVAETGLFRLNQDSVNISMVANELTTGSMIARATKVGQWNGNQWTKCSKTKREWNIAFDMGPRDVDMVATVMDLRVASAAIITLMAFREETISAEDGLTRTGEHNMLLELLWTVFFILLACFLVLLCVMIGRWRRWDMKAYRFCFKLEAALLPKRPARQRLPVYNSTY